MLLGAHDDKLFYRHIKRQHELVHTGEKPYSCTYCEKRFTQSHSLKSHERNHKGEKPFDCMHCDKKFSQSQYAKKHELTHLKDKTNAKQPDKNHKFEKLKVKWQTFEKQQSPVYIVKWHLLKEP